MEGLDIATILLTIESPRIVIAACFQMPVVRPIHQLPLQPAGEGIGTTRLLPGADGTEYGIFLRTTLNVLLVHLQEVSGAVAHRDSFDVLILLNRRVFTDGEVSTKGNRIEIRVSYVA